MNIKTIFIKGNNDTIAVFTLEYTKEIEAFLKELFNADIITDYDFVKCYNCTKEKEKE